MSAAIEPRPVPQAMIQRKSASLIRVFACDLQPQVDRRDLACCPRAPLTRRQRHTIYGWQSHPRPIVSPILPPAPDRTSPDGQDPDDLAERLEEFIHPQVKPLSVVLTEAASQIGSELKETNGTRVTVGQLVEHLSSRGLAPLVLLVALLNVVTIIPGSSTILGMPLVFLGLGLVIGARRIWLPARVRRWSFEFSALEKTVLRGVPWLQKIERLARPRFWLWPGMEAMADRAYGVLVLVFALMITLPVPFGNTMPAITITLISLGFTARDGLWVLAGLVTGTLAVGVILGFAGAAAFLGMQVFGG